MATTSLIQQLPPSRGGMSVNPFANQCRLDRLDFSGENTLVPEKSLYLQTITDAIHNYKFFGLGRNGTTAEEFAYSCEYLFRIRSWDVTTWPVESKIDPEDTRMSCFDVHYELAGLADYMTMDRFLKDLVKNRTRIVDENQGQILAYLNSIYFQECSSAFPGHQLPLPLHDRRKSLISPSSPLDVCLMIYLPPKYTQPPVPATRSRLM